jgi:methyl-accepting chemotaxis protein
MSRLNDQRKVLKKAHSVVGKLADALNDVEEELGYMQTAEAETIRQMEKLGGAAEKTEDAIRALMDAEDNLGKAIKAIRGMRSL